MWKREDCVWYACCWHSDGISYWHGATIILIRVIFGQIRSLPGFRTWLELVQNLQSYGSLIFKANHTNQTQVARPIVPEASQWWLAWHCLCGCIWQCWDLPLLSLWLHVTLLRLTTLPTLGGCIALLLPAAALVFGIVETYLLRPTTFPTMVVSLLRPILVVAFGIVESDNWHCWGLLVVSTRIVETYQTLATLVLRPTTFPPVSGGDEPPPPNWNNMLKNIGTMKKHLLRSTGQEETYRICHCECVGRGHHGQIIQEEGQSIEKIIRQELQEEADCIGTFLRFISSKWGATDNRVSASSGNSRT